MTYFQAEHIFPHRDGEVGGLTFLLLVYMFILLSKRKLSATFPR